MNVMNCRSCGRLFNYLSGQRICPDCQRALEDKFQEVKEYLEEKPNASVDEVARENDVTIKQIKQWVREERLLISTDSVDGIECEKCGKRISTGRFCDVCKATMANNLSALYEKKTSEAKKRERDHNRMRFLQQ